MTFYYSDKLTVTISPNVEDFFLELKESFEYNIEIGGIMAGIFNSGPIITITDVTTPQSKDSCKRFRFLRSETEHQAIMDQLWAESCYQKMYVGEWHTHCESVPSPSWIDTSGWKARVKKTQNTPWILFLILGQQSLRLWTVDAGVVKELSLNAK